jgi:hypothetical protein
MRVPDELLDCVCFLCTQDAVGTIRVGGTAFFVAVPAEKVADAHFTHLVTARHCIRKATETGDALVLRLNLRDGGTTVANITDLPWHFPKNDASDVAVSAALPAGDLSQSGIAYRTIPRSMFLTDEEITDKDIGVGDELLCTGLFFRHVGRKKNQPIVRSGIIAAMPGESLTDGESGLDYEAYLAEVRSIGGLSGSPVFVRLGPGRTAGGVTLLGSPTYFLLGIIRGHWPRGQVNSADFGPSEFESLNTGIAIVTPIADALTVLEGDDFVRERKRQEKQHLQENAPTKDSAEATEDSEFERFESLTSKLVKTPKPDDKPKGKSA